MTVIIPRTNRRYGWIPDLPDNRDKIWTSGRKALKKLPSKVDLRTSGFMPQVYDQGNLGSCTANAIAAAHEYEQRKQGISNTFIPSRLFIYFEERKIINSIEYDSGAYIRDGLKVVNKLGAPHEDIWPYYIGNYAVTPNQESYTDAEKHQTTAYASIDNRIQRPLKEALALGIPVVFGFSVYNWFENPDQHGVCTPIDNQSVLGGHAVLLVGYERVSGSRKEWGIVRNSWGSGWGDNGYCYMPLSWICNYYNADDFWTISAVEE